MKIKEGYYQHKCLVCGDLYTAKGKISLECQECTIKRLEKELAKEKFYSKKYEDEANKLCLSYEGACKQLKEQEQYVELGKAVKWATDKGIEWVMLGSLCGYALEITTQEDLDNIIKDYRNEVNNEA